MYLDTISSLAHMNEIIVRPIQHLMVLTRPRRLSLEWKVLQDPTRSSL